MLQIILNILILGVSIFALIAGSNIFVKQSSAIARKYHIPEFLIGITIVAMGTSLPEFIISIVAAVEGNATIATSNVLGSSIANIGFILAITAIFGAIKINKTNLKFDIPISVVSVLIFLGILYFSDGWVKWSQGILLIIIFIGYFVLQYIKGKRENVLEGTPNHTKISLPLLLFGIIFLAAGGKYSVDSVVEISKLLNISEGFVGFTVLSVGSSLPELIVSIIALRKKHYGLSLGNIVGSNFFNLFLVIGVSALILNLPFHNYIRELIVLIAYNLALIVASFIGKKYYISRREGVFLLLSYLLLVLYLFYK